VLPTMRLGDRASNVSRSCVGLTDRALSLTERASGDAIRLTPMCVETRIYLASSVGRLLGWTAPRHLVPRLVVNIPT